MRKLKEVYQTICGDIPVYEKEETDKEVAKRVLNEYIDLVDKGELKHNDLIDVLNWLDQKET